MRVLLGLTIVFTWIASVVSQADTCPINCVVGECKVGETNYDGHPTKPDGTPFSFHKDTSRQGHYCECPDDRTGVRCGRPFVQCDSGHYCYHGGKCIADQDADPDMEFCDCSSATHSGKPFAGRYCEHEAAVTCDDDGKVFCVNEGTCKADFEGKAHPCNCDDGFRGPHCEFHTGHVPECTDDFCLNGGECVIGIKSYEDALYSDYWDLHEKFMYCDCPKGYFGAKCDVEGEVCGDKHCFNGGTCVSTDNEDGTTSYSCDCRSAHTENDSFGGKYCQSKSSTFCTKKQNQNGHLFCTNGGTCKEDSHAGCDCPDGYHGPICEFTDNEVEDQCNLKCENGGHCRKGALDGSMFNDYGEDLEHLNIEQDGSWEHCVCPDGYFGIKCEHKLEVCEGGEHVCLHGSKCVAVRETTGNMTHECDCDAGFDAIHKYAGKFCQYSSTDVCTESGQPGVKKAKFAFCVNEGKCKRKVSEDERHPGCNCPKGFTGEHCEYLDAQAAVKPKSRGRSRSIPLTTVLGLVVGIVGLSIVFVVMCVPRRELKDELDGNGKPDIATPPTESSGPTPFEAEETIASDTPPSLNGEQKMENVEIV